MNRMPHLSRGAGEVAERFPELVTIGLHEVLHGGVGNMVEKSFLTPMKHEW